jgi:hypothetical protein
MNALSLRNLKKTYNNGFEALKGIDLDVEAVILLLGLMVQQIDCYRHISSLINETWLGQHLRARFKA